MSRLRRDPVCFFLEALAVVFEVFAELVRSGGQVPVVALEVIEHLPDGEKFSMSRAGSGREAVGRAGKWVDAC